MNSAVRWQGIEAVYARSRSIFHPAAIYDFETTKEQSLRGLNQTLRMREDIAALLMQEPGPEIAALWTAATNRLLHRDLYSRWHQIDIVDEFDEVIDRVTVEQPDNEKLSESLESLRTLYLLERDATEHTLLAGSLGVAEIIWRTDMPSSRARHEALVRGYREPLAAAVARRDWYRQQIQLLLGQER